MKTTLCRFLTVPFSLGILLASCSKKSDSTGTGSSGPYFATVKNIIHNNCLSCHSSSGSWEGRPVAFDTDSAIAVQAATIKAAVADPVTPTNKRMPEGGQLSASDISTITKWAAAGGRTTD